MRVLRRTRMASMGAPTTSALRLWREAPESGRSKAALTMITGARKGVKRVPRLRPPAAGYGSASREINLKDLSRPDVLMSYKLGPHIDPPLAAIPLILREGGLSVFQTTLRNPSRLAKEGIPDEADQAAYRDRADSLWGIAHASMLTSLGSPDPRIRNGSASALAGDANLAAALGLTGGVCFHVGYQKGHDDRDAALDAVAYKLRDVLSRLNPGARVLLENGCE